MNDPTQNESCGCCEGSDVRTPLSIFNRPGLPALNYRAGTYSTFLESMLARLGQVTILPNQGDPLPSSSPALPDPGNPANEFQAPTSFQPAVTPLRPLAGLRTRTSSDPAIALLDAWAVAADVLTFYNERIANEGYLRTAIERRSLVELARLVGYAPRPGLSATAYLAFTIDTGNAVVTIPAETKVQSTPEQNQSGQSELPQTFETAEPIEARPAWNEIRSRVSQPQYIAGEFIPADTPLYVKSPNPALKVNDPILLEFAQQGGSASRDLYRVLDAQVLAIPTDAPTGSASIEKARLTLLPWKDPNPSKIPFGKVELYWNIADYYRIAFEPYQSSQVAQEILAILNQPGFAYLSVFNVIKDTSFSAQEFNFPSQFETTVMIGPPGGPYVPGPSPNMSMQMPSAVHGLPELELQLLLSDRVVASVVFKNKDGETAGSGSGATGPFLKKQATQLRAIRAALDSRYNRFAGLVEAAVTEFYMLDWAYEIEAAEPPVQDSETGGVTESKIQKDERAFALLRCVQETTALLGELDHSPRLKPLLQNLLTAKMQQYQYQLDNLSLPVSARLSQVRKSSLNSVLAAVGVAPAAQPAGSRQLSRSTGALFGASSDLGTRLLTRVSPRSGQLYAGWSSNAVPAVYARYNAQVLQKAYVMRVKAGLFGQQLPGKPVFKRVDVTDNANSVVSRVTQIDHYDPFTFEEIWSVKDPTTTSTIYLDREYDKIIPGSWIFLEHLDVQDPTKGLIRRAYQVESVGTQVMAAFGVSVMVTAITLANRWQYTVAIDEEETPAKKAARETATLRSMRVYAQSEPLELVDEPVTLDITGPMVELDGLYEGLQSGKWVIVEGERTDLPGTARVKGAELVMIANVIQDVQMVDEDTPLPGDRPHTFLQLARNGLAFRYRRDTVRVHANVVKATHGETHTQVLGGGDASQAFQTFDLLFKPLTYLPAPTALGAQAALQIRVNNILWHEAPNLAGLEPTDREYLVKTDDDGRTSIIFGDGQHGARLPTAPENVRARYRNGLGRAGNVRGGSLNLLLSRPPGVKEVINPLSASGGADRESPEGIRRSAPLALKALDRLVSVQDYEDFCRIYAGIGKSRAVELPAVGGFLVHITIAGDADIPIDPLDDLYRNLVEALRRAGDPHQPFKVALRERILPVISARVHLQPDYAWEFVEPQVRAALLKLLSFEYRELGQDITSSEVIAAIQGVPGVHYTDLDVLDSVDQARLESFLRLQGEQKGDDRLDLASSLNLRLRPRIPVALARPDKQNPLVILPAQIAYLDDEIRDLLILKEIAP